MLLQGASTIIQGLASSILKFIPVLIPVVVATLQNIVGFITQNLPLIMNAGITILMALITGILPMLPALVDAALGIIVALANGLTSAIPTLLPTIADVIVGIAMMIAKNLPTIIAAAIKLITALVQGLATALPILIKSIPTIVKAILDGLVANAPMLIQAAGVLIGTLITGIIGLLPSLADLMPQLVNTMLDALLNLLSDDSLSGIGKAMIDGIWAGITSSWDGMLDQFSELLKTLPQWVLDILGIKPPEPNPATGESVIRNLANSISNDAMASAAMPIIRRQIEVLGSVRDVRSMAGRSSAPAASVSNSSQNTNNYLFGAKFSVENESSLSAILQATA